MMEEIYDSGVRLVDLALRGADGRVRLVIPGMLLRRAEAFCVDTPALHERLKQLFGGGARSLERQELERLAGELASHSFHRPADEEGYGMVEWLPTSLSGALWEASAAQIRRVSPTALLSLALRRGLLVQHIRDEWCVRTWD